MRSGRDPDLLNTLGMTLKTVWPSGLRRWLKAPVRKGVGSNPTAVNIIAGNLLMLSLCEELLHRLAASMTN